MAGEFNDFIESLDTIGFYDVALPFLLIFTITFAILQKVKIFGKGGKKFNAIVALVMAFLFVRNQNVVDVMNAFLPSISMIGVVIVVVLLLVGIVLTPKKAAGFTGWFGGLAIILILIAVGVSFFGASAPLGWDFPSWLVLDAETWRLLIGLGLFFIFIAWVTSDPETPTIWSQLGDALGNMPGQFGGGDRE